MRVGAALKDGYRERVFLMTKVDGRTKKAVSKQVDESLERLGTDRVDLMQFHEVIRFDDVDRIFNEGGLKQCSRRARPARFATWASRATRTRPSTLHA